MNRISVSELRPGTMLGKDLYSYNGQLLLPRGTILTQSHIDYFREKNIETVYIYENPTVKRNDFGKTYQTSLDTLKTSLLETKLGRPLPEKEISFAVEKLVGQVFEAGDLFRSMRQMKEKDDYLFVHSVNVAVLSILIGRWMGLEEGRIERLALAGFLHDIGKIKIPDEILNKPGRLSGQEFEVVKEHPRLGYEIVCDAGWVSKDVADAVLMHHERMDGSGYPLGLKGGFTNLYARIIAVADVYDAITSNRSYAQKMSPYTAAEILWEQSFGQLDPRATKVLYDRVASFYVGNRVRLSNGDEGVVVYIYPWAPTRPLVQVGEQFYNLNENRDISIQEVLD